MAQFEAKAREGKNKVKKNVDLDKEWARSAAAAGINPNPQTLKPHGVDMRVWRCASSSGMHALTLLKSIEES